MAGCFFHDHLQSLPAWLLLLAGIGLSALLKICLRALRWVFVTFLRPAKNLLCYGSWAVVTGATDGIGRSFALQLAREGLNLVLVGRSADKLRDVSDAVRAEYPAVRVQILAFDLSGDISEGVARLRTVIKGLDVGILVNNAGAAYPFAQFLHEVDEEILSNLIKVHVEGMTKIAQAVLPGMVERKRGAIVNIGSGSANVIPSDPLFSVYCATKAYIDQLSRCLYVEYKGQGIDVQCQVPLYVSTKMTSNRRSSFFVPSADCYARAALRWIGYEPRCSPYWPHSLIWCLMSLFPESIVDQCRLDFCMSIRKRGQLRDSKRKEQ